MVALFLAGYFVTGFPPHVHPATTRFQMDGLLSEFLCFATRSTYLRVGAVAFPGCLGITLSYHRQLSHRSFQTPKWLEYVLAYCGALAVQGDPIEWASSHRYHHLHTDTPLDPHSPYEGFWWSHAGWLLDHEAVEARVSDRSNAADMQKQWFYRCATVLRCSFLTSGW